MSDSTKSECGDGETQRYPVEGLGAHFHTWDDHGLHCSTCTPEQKAHLEQLARDMALHRPCTIEEARAALSGGPDA